MLIILAVCLSAWRCVPLITEDSSQLTSSDWWERQGLSLHSFWYTTCAREECRLAGNNSHSWQGRKSSRLSNEKGFKMLDLTLKGIHHALLSLDTTVHGGVNADIFWYEMHFSLQTFDLDYYWMMVRFSAVSSRAGSFTCQCCEVVLCVQRLLSSLSPISFGDLIGS